MAYRVGSCSAASVGRWDMSEKEALTVKRLGGDAEGRGVETMWKVEKVWHCESEVGGGVSL